MPNMEKADEKDHENDDEVLLQERDKSKFNYSDIDWETELDQLKRSAKSPLTSPIKNWQSASPSKKWKEEMLKAA